MPPSDPTLGAIDADWVKAELIPFLKIHNSRGASSPEKVTEDSIKNAVAKATSLAKAYHLAKQYGNVDRFITHYKGAVARQHIYCDGIMHELGYQNEDFHIYLMVLLQVRPKEEYW
jgi:hypothetical protein